ncbi:hypothetical protein [Butyrivibrio sp. M55]|uniref:hypothetical protein n=1 Tax=Butyrivibrio sp. M55 TaxID=1855323 RepID=UPI0008E048B8|nr:hypothetical protein [Butyrivibrio sp. M55]SFU90827.1 hypothetical protein SAMN05216540_12014 [Butyrivibrio sp. M55]
MNQQLLIITIGGMVLITALLIYNYARNRRMKLERVIVKTKNKKNYLYTFYLLYQKIPPLRRIFKKQYARIALLYPADVTVVNNKVTKDMTFGLGIALAAAIFVIISSGGSIFYICMGLVATYVTYSHIINTRYENLYIKLLQQFKVFLSDVKSNYYSANRQLDTAIYMTVDESPYEMSLHAQKFYDVLNSDDMQLEAAKYNDISPNSYFTTFLAIATTTWQYGDKAIAGVEGTTTSNFIHSMNELKNEVDIELQRIKRNMYLFANLVWVAIGPIFFLKPIQLFGTRGITELSDYYTGSFGTIMMVIVFAASLICYNLIMSSKDIMKKEPEEQPLLTKISNWGFISVFLTSLANKNFSKAEKTTEKLKLNGERIGYKQFLLKRIIWAAVLMIAAQVLIIGAQLEQTKRLMNDFSNAFKTSYQFTDADVETMEYITKSYLAERKEAGIQSLNIDELTDKVQEEQKIARRDQAQMIAAELLTRSHALSVNYYKWFYLFIIFAAGIAGYMLPYAFLLYRASEMRKGMEDEVNQFQTIVIILMNVDNMSVATILEWMERFAYCFKEPISKCIMELPLDEEGALKELRLEPFEPFRRFVNNMLNVNSQGIVAAFEDIASEKANSNEERKIDNQMRAEKKADRAKLIALIPLAIEIGGYLVYPMMAMSTNMLRQLNQSFTG